MIDPNAVTKFDRTNAELLEYWLFCLFVRGKNADVQAAKLQQFIECVCDLTGKVDLDIALKDMTYCKHVNYYTVCSALRTVKAGQYHTLAAAIEQTVQRIAEDPDFLQTATASDLESIRGVGPKTARYFLLHTRKNARVAALDTHILRYLGYRTDMKVPKTTPTGKKYAELEDAFLLMADFEGVDPAAMDLAIWQASRESHPMDWRRYLEVPQ